MKPFEWIRESFSAEYTCPLCGEEKFTRTPFCERCERLLDKPRRFVCPVCGRSSVSEGLCADCKDDPPAFAFCRAVTDYEPPVSRALFKLKFHNQPFLAEPLARKLAELYRAENVRADAVCFVPMSKKREKKRGYNQAQLLAAAFCKELGLPLIPLLSRKKESKVQHTLSRAERKNNLTNCFSADRKQAEDKTLVLIDDVITTGATLDAAATALKKAGARKVYCFTVCATPDPALKKTRGRRKKGPFSRIRAFFASFRKKKKQKDE